MSERKLFAAFSEEQQAEYEQEAMQRYDPEIVKASSQRWKSYTPAEKQRILDEGNAVYRVLLAAMPQGAASAAAQACVARWRRHMDAFWTPNEGQLLALAAGYVTEPRFRANFDAIHPDLAPFILEAVTIYLQRRE